MESAKPRQRMCSPVSVASVIGAISVSALAVGGCAPGTTSSRSDLLATSAAAPTQSAAESVRGVLDQYCVGCHNQRRVSEVGEPRTVLDSQIRAAGLALDHRL